MTSLTVLQGGTIILDAADPAATTEAIAFRAGRVCAIGEEATKLAAQDAATVVDLAGGTVVPGLGEGHAHPILGALEETGPRVREAADLQDILRIVREWKEAHPDAAWIVGASYDATFAPGGLFAAEWLDEVTGDTPTILRAWDYHTAWVNTAALRAGEITADTPDPALGRIVRKPDGSPLGTLQEAAANNFLRDVVPAFALEQRVAAIERATKMYAAQGTTWVQDAWVDLPDIAGYVAAARAGKLHTRVNLAFRADPLTWREDLSKFLAAREEIARLASERLSANTIKFFMDGVIESHTAALLAPYADRPADCGIPNWQGEELFAAAIAFANAGFQLHLHAIGDGANRWALDAVEAVRQQAAPGTPAAELPYVIAHVALLDPADVGRFAKLGVIANFEPYWAQCDAVMRDLTIPHIGHSREEFQYMIGSVLRAGAQVSFGSDWPVTTPDWRPAFATAVTRRSHLEPEGESWLPAECVTAAAALTAYTRGCAAQALATDRGTLTIGQVADAVWLDANPLTIEPVRVPEIRVLATWLAGDRTF